MAFGRIGGLGAGFAHLGSLPGGSVAVPVGGGALLSGETSGFATDFTYATDANRVAVKTAGAVVYSTVDGFFTQAGTSPKLVFDVAGALAWSPHNMFTRSEDASHGDWTRNNVSAPSATRIVEDAVTGAHNITATTPPVSVAGMPYCFWVEATAAECDRFMLYGLSLGGQGLGFDVTTGTTFAVDTIPSGGLLSSGILSLGGGRYRCWISLNAGSTTGNPALYMCSGTAFSYAGNASRGLTLHRQQLNRGTAPTAYLATTTAARVGLALDYDPTTHAAKGLLVEPAATNLLLNNTTLSTQSVTVTAVAHTLSIFGTGTVTLTGVSTAGPLVGTGAGNRVSLTFTPTAGSLTCTVSGSVTNAQLEIGSSATSVVPTVGTTATRAADSVSFLLSAIPALSTEFTLYGRWQTPSIASARLVYCVTDALGTPGDYAGFLANTTANLSVVDGTVSQANAVTVGSIVANTVLAIAGRVKANDFSVSKNGAAVVTDVSGTQPTVTQVRFGNTGGNAVSTAQFNIEKMVILPRGMCNAELVVRSAT